MTNGLLDSFQLMVAVYLFYTAVKGRGTLYNFPEIPPEKKDLITGKLRLIYTAGGFISLLDWGASVLQNSMFTVNWTETGREITQNFTVGALPFISGLAA